MSAAERWARAIRRVCGVAVLTRGETRTPFLASIQPRPAVGAPEAGPLGFGAASLHTLYAPCGGAGETLAAGDLLESHGRRYRVVRSELFLLAGEAVYRWAVLCEEGA